MNAVLAAVYQTVANSPGFTAIGGDGAGSDLRLFRDLAPDEPTYPYIVFSPITAEDERGFTDRQETHEIQFDIVDESRNSEAVVALADTLTNLFFSANVLDTRLPGGMSTIGAWPQTYSVSQEEEFFRAIVTVRVSVSGTQ